MVDSNSLPLEAVKIEASYFGLAGLEEIVSQKISESEKNENEQ